MRFTFHFIQALHVLLTNDKETFEQRTYPRSQSCRKCWSIDTVGLGPLAASQAIVLIINQTGSYLSDEERRGSVTPPPPPPHTSVEQTSGGTTQECHHQQLSSVMTTTRSGHEHSCPDGGVRGERSRSVRMRLSPFVGGFKSKVSYKI